MTAKRRGSERAAHKEELRGFCREVLRFIHSQVPDPRALDLEGHLRAIDDCSSLRGLKIATSDMLEWTQDVRGDRLTAIDDRLTHLGLPTLSRMRSAAHRRFAEILARGRIRTDEEARFIEARLSDVGDTGPSTVDRDLAERLMLAYRH